MKNYNILFEERFSKSQKYDENFSDLFNTKGLKEAIEYLKSIGATKLDIENYYIKYTINRWTQNDLNEAEKKELIEKLKELKDYVIDVKFEENKKFNVSEVVIETIDGTIRAIQFSKFKPNVKKYIPNIEDKTRYGNCYIFSFYISIGIPFKNYLTTGYVYGYSDKSKFLHSWVEVNLDGEDYVIDATLNAMVNKEGYYLMENAKPINKISKQTLIDDLDNYKIIDNENIPIEVYYVFRDEIIEDLIKNKDILQK